MTGIAGSPGRSVPRFFHYDQGCHDLSWHRCHCCTGDSHFRHSQHSKDQKRIQNDIDDCTCDLSDHWCPHIALCLQDLTPDSLRKKTNAEKTDDPAVCHHIPDHFRGICWHTGICRQRNIADCCKNNPQDQSQRCTSSRHLFCFFLLSDSKIIRHISIDTDSCSHSQCDHEKLHRIDDRQCRKSGLRILSYKKTVYNIV